MVLDCPLISSMNKQHAFFFTPPISQFYLGHQIKKIYFDNVYAPFVKGETILDVGANLGMISYYFSQFAKQVFSLEPAKEHFTNFKKMIDFNNIKNITAINKAMYIKSGKYPLFKNKNKTMFSLHAAVQDGSQKSEEVETITIKDLFKEHKIEHIDLMKLDVEGSEIEIVSHSTFVEVAPKIDTVIVESHAWSGRHENQLKEALKNAGYTVETRPSDANLLVGRRA